MTHSTSLVKRLSLLGIGVAGLAMLRHQLKQILHPHTHGTEHNHGLQTEGNVIRWAGLYDHVVNVLAMGKEAELRQLTVELAQVQPGEKILDVGCGTGSLTIAAKAQAGAGGEVVGTDAAREMIDVARQKAAAAGADVTFQPGVIEKIAFPDNEFDLVLSSLMMHHLPGDELKQRGLAEVYRVLKPNGRLLIVDFMPPTNLLNRAMMTLRLGHFMSQDNDLAAMMQTAGFTEIETGNVKYKWLSFVRGHKRA